MANNYKKDDSKPPVLDAVLIPYRRSLLAIAAMKADMAVKHKIQGAVNPYLEWAQLPNAEARLGNAGARHVLDPWSLNTQDALPGTQGHLHMVHGIVGLLMALELHLKAMETSSLAAPTMPSDGPNFGGEPLHVPAGADWREKPPACAAWLNPGDGLARVCRKDEGHPGPHEDNVGLRW